MKFILTINWTLINFNEISKIEYEYNEHQDKYYSYFMLKNGDKYDAHESFHSFQVNDGIDYLFNAWCHKTFNLILLDYILLSTESIIKLEDVDNVLWSKFIYICSKNIDKLSKKPIIIGHL
jgi:hypothetical protein